jgi:hypothetical protein
MEEALIEQNWCYNKFPLVRGQKCIKEKRGNHWYKLKLLKKHFSWTAEFS